MAILKANMHQLGSILTKRLRLNFNDNFGLQECWSQEVSLMSYNMEGTVNFIVTECSIEDFFWLGEVFEDVAKETKSQAFVECLYKKLATITEAEYNSQVFSINFRQLDISYTEYIKQLTDDITYADGQL